MLQLVYYVKILYNKSIQDLTERDKMKIEITQKNYDANQRFTNVLESKLLKFKKFLDENDKVKVKLSKVGSDNYTMEINVLVRNKMIRAAVTSYNMWDNIDLILPKLERQINKTTEKTERRNAEPYVIYSKQETVDDKSYNSYGKIVKEKNFPVSIITTSQAVEEMEMLDHNFYIFINAENNKVSVVYKRLDGNYGLITPEY